VKGIARPLSAWMGFVTSGLQQGVNCQLHNGVRAPLISPVKFPMAKFLTTWGSSQRYCAGLNALKWLGGFLHFKSTQQCWYCGGVLQKFFLYAQMSIQGVEYALTVIYLLLVPRNVYSLFFFY